MPDPNQGLTKCMLSTLSHLTLSWCNTHTAAINICRNMNSGNQRIVALQLCIQNFHRGSPIRVPRNPKLACYNQNFVIFVPYKSRVQKISQTCQNSSHVVQVIFHPMNTCPLNASAMSFRQQLPLPLTNSLEWVRKNGGQVCWQCHKTNG